jgi:glycosyltransferase involved in cell wall biosynthesis
MAAAMARLFHDPALRQRMGQAARQRIVENYSTAQVAERYEALFAEICGAG